MKNFFKAFLIILVISFPNTVKSQNLENVEDYIVNEWSLEYYEIGSKRFPPKSGNENDKMIFTKDHKSVSVSNGISQIGTWEFDSASNILLVIDEESKFNMKLKVISCSKTNCVLTLKNEKNQDIRLFLVAK